jgi:hypothetical protein
MRDLHLYSLHCYCWCALNLKLPLVLMTRAGADDYRTWCFSMMDGCKVSVDTCDDGFCRSSLHDQGKVRKSEMVWVRPQPLLRVCQVSSALGKPSAGGCRPQIALNPQLSLKSASPELLVSQVSSLCLAERPRSRR